MSELHRLSMVRLIKWLLIKNGFTKDQADAIVDKLFSELGRVTVNHAYRVYTQRHN